MISNISSKPLVPKNLPMKPKKIIILAVSIAIIVITLSLFTVFSENHTSDNAGSKLSRVACLGDSITQVTGYPANLQALLGNCSVVGNFGVSGSAVNFEDGEAYYFEPAFHNALLFEPTIVIIMLGTNDAHPDVYEHVNNFVLDYERIIDRIETLPSKPQIFLVEPPPVFNNTLGIDGISFAQGIIPRILEVANQTGLPIIDLYTPLLNHPEYFSDGVHPNSEGAQIIANIIYEAITSNSA
jgi:lysophospholipase L1-like esterase